MNVYGWIGYRPEARPAPNGSRQTREIVAARSVTEVMRLTGRTRRELTWNGDWTSNAEEIRVASAEPGVVFWRGLDDRDGTWNRAASSVAARLMDEVME